MPVRASNCCTRSEAQRPASPVQTAWLLRASAAAAMAWMVADSGCGSRGHRAMESSSALASCHHALSGRLPMLVAIPASPGAGRGPRSSRSSARTSSSHSRRVSPACASGCLNRSSSGTGAKSSARHCATASRNRPGGVTGKASPALSSASISQRRRCAITRAARLRSGVTMATRRAGMSSAWRTSSAIACASSSGFSASTMRMPFVLRSAASSVTQRSLSRAGMKMLRSNRARSAARPALGSACQGSTSARLTVIAWSSCFR